MIEFDELRNDFEVSYRFLLDVEGGRKNQNIYQGYRCDWVYADFEEAEPRQAWMIWPLFLNANGEFVPKGTQVPSSGIAHMMIVDLELRRTIHRDRIRPGVKGFFVEGLHKVAEATVVRVVELSRD